MLRKDRDCGMKMETNFETGGFSGLEYGAAANIPAMPMMDTNMCGESYPGVVCPPVYECPQERVCHRYICHEVPHICPCNTRIINHHIYRHTYSPAYSCCEENEVSNVYDRKCC